MAGKINRKLLEKEILSSTVTQKLVLEKVKEEVNKNKELFTQEFNSHPVTQEIQGGASASNSSGTLGGYGNLFSFIGFNKGSDPISPVRALINKINAASISFTKNKFNVKVIVPSIGDFQGVSKMPWEGGRSWLIDMEKGISGLGAYLYKQYNKSRSGYGLQSNFNYKSTVFRPTKYFVFMYNKFLKKLGGTKQ
jgi:hypothetical protein